MLNDLFEFLNKNSGSLTVLFTAVVTISTVVYAILTGKLVSETKKIREVQTEPKLEITLKSLEFAINIVRIHIRNIGLGPAENVQFKTSVVSGGQVAKQLLEEFTQTNFFKTGMRYLGPDQEIYSHYTDLTQNYDQKIESVLLLELKYEGAIGKKYSEKSEIDMSELKGGYQLGKPNLYSMAKSIEKIQKDIAHIASGHKRIKADVYTHVDRKEKEKSKKGKN